MSTLMPPQRKILYEWVVVSSQGEKVFLTEKQWDFYKTVRKEGTVTFDNFEVNPSFVVQAYKRPAQALIEIYPCRMCHKEGYVMVMPKKKGDGVTYDSCPNCGGTGVDFKNYVSQTE
jgi:rubrerythrin